MSDTTVFHKFPEYEIDDETLLILMMKYIRHEKLSLITWKISITPYMQKGNNSCLWNAQLIQSTFDFIS